MNGLCGCCESDAPLTPRDIDNRPGLSAIAYRIGTYASFRESMLEAIARTAELGGLGTRRDDDDAIALLDLWAAAADVLTFYTERYANEAFLRTASQSDSVRRLAALLGYNPRPGVAALAQLAFTADPGTIIPVAVGLRVQSAPARGQLPQTFETIEAATVDARLSRLRIFPQPIPLNALKAGSMEATLARRQGPALAANLGPNDQIVVFNNFGSAPPEEKKLKQIRMEDDRVIVRWTQAVQADTWSTSSLAGKFRRKLQLFGCTLQKDWIHPVQDSTVPGGIRWVFDDLTSQFALSASTTYDLDSKYSNLAAGTGLLFVVPSGSTVNTTLRTVIGAAHVHRTLGPLSDTVTRVTLDGAVVACPDLRSVVIYELTGDDLLFDGTAYSSTLGTGAVYLPGILRVDGGGPGVEVGRIAQQNGFAPGVVIHPSDLAPGRKVIVTDARNNPMAATLHAAPAIDPPGASAGSFVHLVLTLDAVAGAASLETASAVVLGNVVLASHGETIRNEVAGSGDASQRFQRFPLQKQPLTFVPGSGPNGVVSSLGVHVNGLLWQEVGGLFDQPPTAQVFSTSIGSDLKTVLQFGDSRIGGSVLPTGAANVTATYRVGSGLSGRVGPNALTTLLDRLQGLSSVTNPQSAEGGADPESLAATRENAPRTVRTFGRAVSLQDFEDLITASGEVAKAEAIWIWDGLSPAVYLTIAGQAGGTFSNPAALAGNLNASRDPNRRLLVGNFQSVPIKIAASVLVSPRYASDVVLSSVRAALLGALSFDALRLGQSIHLSAIYAILQAVPGIIAVDIDHFGFRQPDGMSAADFDVYQDRRAVLRLTGGTVAPVQEHLRMFSGRPDRSVPGTVLPAELAVIQTPDDDVSITAQGS